MSDEVIIKKIIVERGKKPKRCYDCPCVVNYQGVGSFCLPLQIKYIDPFSICKGCPIVEENGRLEKLERILKNTNQ